MTSDGRPEVARARGICPRQIWALIDPSEQLIGLIQVPEATMPAVRGLCAERNTVAGFKLEKAVNLPLSGKIIHENKGRNAKVLRL